jgi:hypothetical protein
MTAEHWGLPGSWEDEERTTRQIAEGLRADEHSYRDEYYRRRDEGAPQEELDALMTSRYHAMGLAARIERQIRGIE